MLEPGIVKESGIGRGQLDRSMERCKRLKGAGAWADARVWDREGAGEWEG